MLSDNEQAMAYAHVQEAIDSWNSLLNVLYDTFIEKDMEFAKAVGKHLHDAKEILDVK